VTASQSGLPANTGRSRAVLDFGQVKTSNDVLFLVQL